MKIRPFELAKIIGASPEYVRMALQQNRLGYGSAVKMSRRWTYNIMTEEVARQYGVNVSEIDQQLAEIRKGVE